MEKGTVPTLASCGLQVSHGLVRKWEKTGAVCCGKDRPDCEGEGINLLIDRCSHSRKW